MAPVDPNAPDPKCNPQAGDVVYLRRVTRRWSDGHGIERVSWAFSGGIGDGSCTLARWVAWAKGLKPHQVKAIGTGVPVGFQMFDAASGGEGRHDA